MAPAPPASSAGARSRGQEKVGCSSTLSSTPSRPLVPAPTVTMRPPARSRGTAASTAAASCGAAARTASAASAWSATKASTSAAVS